MASSSVRLMLQRLTTQGAQVRLLSGCAALRRPQPCVDSCSQTPCTGTARLLNVLTSPKDVNVASIFTARYSTVTNVDESVEIWLDDLLGMLNTGHVRLIDVRDKCEIDEFGMIPSSINIPLQELTKSLTLTDAEFRKTYGIRKPNTDDDQLVFYALSGEKSAPAVELANSLGYKRARHYVGGWYEWSIKCKTEC